MKKPSLHFGEFTQMSRIFLTQDDGIDCEQITSAAFCGETLYLASPDCYYTFENGKLTKHAGCISKFFNPDGEFYAASGNDLYRFDGGKFQKSASFDAPVLDISKGLDSSFWLITETMLYRKNGDDFEPVCPLPEDTVCLAALDDKSRYGETVYIGSSTAGLMSMKGKRRHWSELLPDVTGALSMNISCIKIDAMGDLWVGTDKGLNVYDGRNYWFSDKDVDSLPGGSFNDMVFLPNGKKYFATDTGLVLLHEGKLSYYSYGIWLKHPKVSKIAVSANGTIAAVTERGVSVITPIPMTLEKKAANFDAIAEKYFVRKDGYSVTRCLRKAGDIESGWLPNSDNDGLFTGLYCASQCFRYRVTGDETAKANATRAINAMRKLTEITNHPGFTARAIRYLDEENYGTGAREEWHQAASDPDCEWLGETSSDEMTGHYFAYAVYYDLCADDEEKAWIAETVRAITDHIIDNNFRLTDVDGIPTTWANWDPTLLNNDDRWYFERGTNSLEILSFLKTAYHITGDEKYDRVFDKLVREHHYGMNTMQYKVEDAHVAHIDDQLDFINIYPLILYTENEAQREIFKMGLTHHWKYERIESSPFFNIVYGALTSNPCDIENAAVTLSEMTLDLIRWPVYNSYRKDLVWDDEQEAIGLPRQLKVPVEYHSRYVMHYDTSPFCCDSGCEEFVAKDEKQVNRTAFLPGTDGADGKHMMMPYIYLLPYWMGRYYGLLAD